MNNNPKISVVTVCYNAASEIERTIKSVINQTYSNIEYIIIDGGSKDGTVDIIKKYADKVSYWVSEPDKGIYDAMNKGIIAATGDWINFMNAGDWFYATNVLEQIASIAQTTSADILYGNTMKVLERYHFLFTTGPTEEMNEHMANLHQSTFTRLSYHKAHLFDTSYKLSGDYHFFYNAYFTYQAKFEHIPITVDYFDLTKGMSKDNFMLARREDWRFQAIADSSWKKFLLKIKYAYYNLKQQLKCLVFSEEQRIAWNERAYAKRGYVLIPNSQLPPL